MSLAMKLVIGSADRKSADESKLSNPPIPGISESAFTGISALCGLVSGIGGFKVKYELR